MLRRVFQVPIDTLHTSDDCFLDLSDIALCNRVNEIESGLTLASSACSNDDTLPRWRKSMPYSLQSCRCGWLVSHRKSEPLPFVPITQELPRLVVG